ncbi:hypothetical protein D7231_31955 [Streptomyces klenkii]|uniref:Uncharacterized protein n=1 Tax=Streptomyces klenkii TaxID=1420899 RepID=A0A3B0AR68_9ACTN|nr:hypothetical protein [Streptomyces klenkii]RKN61887.1 hypothetical protein D7231_31955 [Streptomyces klenkii]
MTAHEVRPGQVYVACDPRDGGRRIRVEAVHGLRATVVTLTAQGPARRRVMWTDLLHPTPHTPDGQPRHTGYALETP